MLPDLIFAIFIGILTMVNKILDGFAYVIPNQIQDAINYFMGYLNYLKGILPIQDILLAFIAYLTAWGLIYVLKILFMFLSAIPWLRVNLHLPNHREETIPLKNFIRK